LRDPAKGRTLTRVKSLTYDAIKAQESRRRVSAARQARRSARAAAVGQRRVSLTGRGTQWQITNLRQVAHAMAQWA
jgi:hypothetical protein